MVGRIEHRAVLDCAQISKKQQHRLILRIVGETEFYSRSAVEVDAGSSGLDSES